MAVNPIKNGGMNIKITGDNMFNIFKKDPSTNWEKSKIKDLILDLTTGSLNFIQFGDKPEKLSYFGKPDNKNPFEKKYFFYGEAGLIIGIEEGVVAYISITTIDNPYEKLSAASFHLKDFQGVLQKIDKETTIDMIEKILGKPDEIHEHDEGVDQTFFLSKYQIEIEFDNERKIVCFDITLR